MKTLVTVAAALALSSALAFADESTPQAPVQMTDSEMGQVVAGGLGLNPKNLGDGLDPKDYLGSRGKGDGDGICQQ